MEKREYSATELARNWSEISATAMRSPVTLTRHKKVQFVLMSKVDYDKLRSSGDPRRVGTIDLMPDELVDEIEAAIGSYGNRSEEP